MSQDALYFVLYKHMLKQAQEGSLDAAKDTTLPAQKGLLDPSAVSSVAGKANEWAGKAKDWAVKDTTFNPGKPFGKDWSATAPNWAWTAGGAGAVMIALQLLQAKKKKRRGRR